MPLLEFKPGIIDKKLYKGKIKDGKHWKDKRGENVVILTQTGIYWSNVYDATRGAKIFAYHFIKTADNSFKEIWKISEVVEECAFEVEVRFLLQLLSVTDLTMMVLPRWVLYFQGMQIRTSPERKKLVFYEGKDLVYNKGNYQCYKRS